MRAWDALPAETNAAKTGTASVANPQDTNLTMDINVGKQTRIAELILEICEKIGIDRSSVSVTYVQHLHWIRTGPCERRERGHHFREPFLPYPPREPDRMLEPVAKSGERRTETIVSSEMAMPYSGMSENSFFY